MVISYLYKKKLRWKTKICMFVQELDIEKLKHFKPILLSAGADWPSGEPGSQFGPLPYFFFFYVVVFACRIYTKVIISEFAIQ